MEGWKKDNLGNLLELVYGKSLPKSKRADGNIPVYGSNGIVGFHDEAIVNEPGIIVGRKGSAGNIHFSKVPFCPIDTTFYITQQHSKLELDYLYYALNFLDLKRILGDVGVPGLNREMAYLEELFYPLDKAEQRKIAHVLSTVQKAIEQQDNLIRTTIELKKALMQKLFTEGTRGEPLKKKEIGLLPESWEVVSINQIKTLMQYGTSVKCDYKFEGVPVVRIPNVISGKVDISDLKFGKPKNNELEKLKLDNGDLLFVRTNGAKELSGRCAIFRNEIDSCYYASYLIRLKLDTDKVNPDFLNYYAQTELGKSFLSGKAIRTADGKYNINTGILNNVLFPKPKLNEQKEIVEIISLIEEKIALQNKKEQTLTALFKTLLHELMTGQRRVHDMEFEARVSQTSL